MILSHLCIYFIYDFINDALSTSDFIASNNRVIIDNKLEMIRNEAAVASFQTLSRNVPGGLRKTKKTLVRLAGLSPEIRTRNHQNAKQD
jgi:hypothetical protein